MEKERRRFLVVDDDQDCAETLAMVLRRLGADVRVAYGGVHGLGLLNHFDPEVILLDICMPEMDGYELASKIRSLPTDRPFFLVALTGWGRAEDKLRASEAGFNLHIVKPADLSTLRQLVKGPLQLASIATTHSLQ